MDLYSTKIVSSGIYHPPKILTNFDLEKMVDTSDSWIYERTGIKQRHVAAPGIGPSDLAVPAVKQAIENSGLELNDIDCILFSTSSPDMRMPNSASILQFKLGITNHCACFDLMAACSGFLYGLNMANASIASGLFKTVLLVGSEVLSYFINFNDRTTCILFGDGCGVFLLTRNEDANPTSKVLSSVMCSEGQGKDLILLDTGGPCKPITKEILENEKQYVSMQGQETFKLAVKTMVHNSEVALEKAGLTLSDIDWIIPHQANTRIIQAVTERLNAPKEKVLSNIENYGNTSCASIPVAMHEAIKSGKIKRGDLVLLTAFGSGLTSATTVLRY